MNTLEVEATKKSLMELTELFEMEMEKHGCPPKMQMQFDIAFEELFVNIVNYAYQDGRGNVLVTYDIGKKGEQRSLNISLEDCGTPYNPLSKADPDITLSAEERKTGGLGVFMAKKFLDSIRYEWKEGYNRIFFEKKWRRNEGE